jgi:hypothetical protein
VKRIRAADLPGERRQGKRARRTCDAVQDRHCAADDGVVIHLGITRPLHEHITGPIQQI